MCGVVQSQAQGAEHSQVVGGRERTDCCCEEAAPRGVLEGARNLFIFTVHKCRGFVGSPAVMEVCLSLDISSSSITFVSLSGGCIYFSIFVLFVYWHLK